MTRGASGNNGYVKLRRGIHDGEHRSKLPPTRFAVYVHLILDADSSTGVVFTSAGSLVSRHGFTERAARDALERLEKDGYIVRFPVRGRHHEYPALVNHYEVTTGAMRGRRLNAAKSTGCSDLVFDQRDDDVHDSVNDDVNENGELGAMTAPVYKEDKKEKEKEKYNASSSVPAGQSEGIQLELAPKNDRKNGHSKWPDPRLLIEMYNELTPDESPAVDRISPARIKKSREYLKQFPDRAFWEQVYANVHRSSFLRGYKSSPGHENFKADFDWLLSKGKNDQVENCVKVYEGKYTDG